MQLLRKCDFSDSKWMELGLRLGLKKNTLDAIEANFPLDVGRRLIECLSKWLERADDVNSKGGATWDSLSTGLRSMGEIAVAEKLDQEKELSVLMFIVCMFCIERPQVLALSIFDIHRSLLSESLSDPVRVARLLNAERVISTQVVISVEDESRSILNQRQILLSALREAIQANHTCLQSFAIVLLKVTGNVQLGQVILSNYGEYTMSDNLIMLHFSHKENIFLAMMKLQSSKLKKVCIKYNDTYKLYIVDVSTSIKYIYYYVTFIFYAQLRFQFTRAGAKNSHH